jgi:hypothetical protein
MAQRGLVLRQDSLGQRSHKGENHRELGKDEKENKCQ